MKHCLISSPVADRMCYVLAPDGKKSLNVQDERRHNSWEKQYFVKGKGVSVVLIQLWFVTLVLFVSTVVRQSSKRLDVNTPPECVVLQTFFFFSTN